MRSNCFSSSIKNARVSTVSFRSRSSDGDGPSAGRTDAARLFLEAAKSQPTKTKRTKTQAEKNNRPQYSVAKRPDICLRSLSFRYATRGGCAYRPHGVQLNALDGTRIDHTTENDRARQRIHPKHSRIVVGALHCRNVTRWEEALQEAHGSMSAGLL